MKCKELVEKAGESPTKRTPSEVDVQILPLQCLSQVVTFSFTLAILNDNIYWGCDLSFISKNRRGKKCLNVVVDI